jgi:hypothetical protein
VHTFCSAREIQERIMKASSLGHGQAPPDRLAGADKPTYELLVHDRLRRRRLVPEPGEAGSGQQWNAHRAEVIGCDRIGERPIRGRVARRARTR